MPVAVASFTLRVYTHIMRRDKGERERLKALVNGEDLGGGLGLSGAKEISR